MEQLIAVSFSNGAWFVEARECLEPMLFSSGGRAEQVARRLACCLAEAGSDVRIEVRDKHNTLVGAHCYFAAPPDLPLPDKSDLATASAFWRRRAIANSSERISAVS